MVAFEIGEIESIDALGGGCEVSVDFEAIEVAYDQEGRVAEILAVVVDLLVGGFQVFVLALVLPGEVVAEPDIGEAFAAASLADVFFEGVIFSGGVGCGRMGLAEHLAEVDEMGLGAGILGLREELPAMNELRDGERHGLSGSVQRDDGAGAGRVSRK